MESSKTSESRDQDDMFHRFLGEEVEAFVASIMMGPTVRDALDAAGARLDELIPPPKIVLGAQAMLEGMASTLKQIKEGEMPLEEFETIERISRKLVRTGALEVLKVWGSYSRAAIDFATILKGAEELYEEWDKAVKAGKSSWTGDDLGRVLVAFVRNTEEAIRTGKASSEV